LVNQMIVVGSTPLSIINGKNPMDYAKDVKGMKALKELGRNIAYSIQQFHGNKEPL